jgi:hypothetical protein
MFTIIPKSFEDVEKQLLQAFGQVPLIWGAIKAQSNLENTETVPFIQLSRDEVSQDEVERVFSHLGIANVNITLGLPISTIEFSCYQENGVLFYCLDGLETDLINLNADLISKYRASTSFDNFLDEYEDSLTACDYLIAGTLNLISYCKINQFVLTIRW